MDDVDDLSGVEEPENHIDNPIFSIGLSVDLDWSWRASGREGICHKLGLTNCESQCMRVSH